MQGDLNFTLTATSPSSASTVVGPASDPVTQPLAGYRSMRLEASLQGATGGTLDVYIQVSYDKGVSWTDYCHFTQLGAGGAAIVHNVSCSRSFAAATPVTVGKGTTPVLAANTCLAGEWGDRMRLLFVAGASTSAGAAQTIRVYLHA